MHTYSAIGCKLLVTDFQILKNSIGVASTIDEAMQHGME
jgi:hypothetical protein